MVRVLTTLHDVDITKAGLSDYGRPGSYFARQVSRWSQQYRATQTRTIDSMEALIDWLPGQIPAEDDQTSLIHGDYRIDNLIFAPAQLRINAVLDWELSTLGHPLADLAYFCMCLRMPSDGHIPGLAGIDRASLGIPNEAEIVERYCSLRDLGPICNWHFYLAFSFFRLAAICQGVHKRALDGNASSNQALAVGALAEPLAKLGAELL
jgi:aminoglycoside phosphotransferase (APT) family kinase protein